MCVAYFVYSRRVVPTNGVYANCGRSKHFQEFVDKYELFRTLGKQSICGEKHLFKEGTQSEQLRDELPRSFSFLGQRFGLDSWVLSSIVDLENPYGVLPSTLDIAFTVCRTCSDMMRLFWKI